MTLSPTMAQEDMDSFLKSLGATDNPFTVEDLFDGRKTDVVWTRMQRVPPIARGTSCPGHVLVPWAHSPIWSRQDPIFVSLTQIASYKR